MKVITPARKGKGSYVGLARLRKRTSIGEYSRRSGGPVYLTTLKSQMVSGTITATGVRGHGLFEIDAGDFIYTSHDHYLTLTNSAAITALVVTKGVGAGTVVTDANVSVGGLVSIEKVV